MVSFPAGIVSTKFANICCCCCWNCVNMLYLIKHLVEILIKCFEENHSSASIHCTHHSENVQTYILGFITHFTLVSF